MRTLKRNRQRFWYAHYKGKEPVVNENGFETGDHKVTYYNPIPAKGNISAGRSTLYRNPFGIYGQYDRTIIPDRELDIDESCVLWVDVDPVLNADGSTDTPSNYMVAGIAKSLNVTQIAIKKVV